MESFLLKYDLNTLKRIKNYFSDESENNATAVDELEDDIEILQAVVYSILIEQKDLKKAFLFIDLNETFFISKEIISILLENVSDSESMNEDLFKELFDVYLTDYKLSPDQYQLQFLQGNKDSADLTLQKKYPPNVILVCPPNSNQTNFPSHYFQVCSAGPNASNPPIINKFFLSCINFMNFPFGMYNFNHHSLVVPNTTSPTSSQETLLSHQNILITSPLYDFNLALENFFEFYYWEFQLKSQWNSVLENILCELLVCIHEDFRVMISRWKSVMGAFSSSSSDNSGGMNPGHDFEKFYQIILEDIQIILAQEQLHKVNYAIGRLHQTFDQLLEIQFMSSFLTMFQMPEFFREKVQEFIVNKCNNAFTNNLEFVDLLSDLVRERFSLICWFSF
jgi:hypothetical protein